jgi:hypothetical protein
MPVVATSGTDQLIAWSTLASAIIVAVAAALAWWQLQVARRVRGEETRPYVFIDVETRNDHLIWIVIHNSGLTPAHNVSFEFNPQLQSTMDASTEMRSRADFMDQTWPILPPGKRIETIFDSTVDLFNSDLPTRYEVTAQYTDGYRNRCGTSRSPSTSASIADVPIPGSRPLHSSLMQLSRSRRR